jgi:colicin import membrane protein
MPESDILLRYQLDMDSFKEVLNAAKAFQSSNEALIASSGELNQANEDVAASLLDMEKAGAASQRQFKQQQKASEEAKKETNALADALKRIERQKNLDSIVKSAVDLEKKTKDTDAAVKQLEADLKKVGATSGEVGQAAQQFETMGDATRRRGSLVGISRGISRFRGVDLSTTGGIAEAGLGLGELASSLPEVGKRAKEAVSSLTGPGGVAGSLAQLGVAGGLAIVAIAAIGIAIKKFADDAKKQAEELASVVDARRKVGQEIAQGLTTEEATKRQEEINRLREEETALLKDLKDAEQQYKDETGALGGVIGAVDPRVKKLKEEIAESEKLIDSYNAEQKALGKAIDGGKLSANDAAKAEEQLAQERGAVSDSTVEAANKEKQAQQEREKAAKEAQQQQEKAMQEWVAQQERIAQISENYASAVANAARGASQATQDAGRKLKDSFADIRTGAGRQLADDAIKAKQDELDLKRKQYEDEQKLIRDHQRAMRDIIKNANRDQEGLLAERDFLSLDQLSKQTRREIEDQQQADKDAQDDQQRANTEELRDFQQQQQRVRAERLRDYERSITDTRTQNQRELRDIQINKQRQLQQAAEARNKELQLAQEGINRKLKLEAEYWRRSAALIPGGNGGTTAAGATGGMGSVEDFVLSTIGAIGLT